MNPEIITIPEKKVIGMKSEMRHSEYGKIVDLWKCFMPNKKKVNSINNELIAMQVYSDFMNIDDAYDIYACAEVEDFKHIPEMMETFVISRGKYAVFHHKGVDASGLYQRIMTHWLPNSEYEIDARPHFQVMGEKYKNGSPDSEEEFYVPIKSK